MFSFLKSVVFLAWLSTTLAALSIGMAVWSFQLSVGVAKLSAEAAATAIRHRKEVLRTVARVKAKARLQRTVAMIPIAGIAAGAYFEEQEFQEWLVENPDGTRQEYACGLAIVTAEVMDEVLQALPDKVRPSPQWISEQVPECEPT
jgi:hypothetical protein|tara:strand:+ start:42 stop:479 length:438 start_codon:yes stop_codon:yes gene_type:complete